jgi:hypothetical protein
MTTNSEIPTIPRAGSISRIFSGIGLKRAPKTSWGSGFEIVQWGTESRVYWTQTSSVENSAQAFAKMRDALAPKGYLIETEQDENGSSHFTVTRTDRVLTEDARRTLNRGRRVYEYTPGGSGFHVEACPTDHRVVMVSFKASEHISLGDDSPEEKGRIISRTLGLYAEILEEDGYSTHLVGNTLLVGVSGNRHWPTLLTPKSSSLALSELRDAVEHDDLDYYTRLAPGKNSIFVIRGVLRAEVFYNGDTGLYRAMPRFGGFGHVRSNDIAKVLEFLRDELGD